MDTLRICYRTFEVGSLDIHVRMLRDTLQFMDKNGAAEKMGICSAAWPIFGVIWPAGEVLARRMLDFVLAEKCILEIGCGIGLASLVLNHRNAHITATDHNPEAGRFLNYNTRLNRGKKIPFVCTGWADDMDDLGLFDTIIGSDLLYERNHGELLSGFIDRHAKQHCEVIIVDPDRGNRGLFSRKMADLKFNHEQEKPPFGPNDAKPFKGRILHFIR